MANTVTVPGGSSTVSVPPSSGGTPAPSSAWDVIGEIDLTGVTPQNFLTPGTATDSINITVDGRTVAPVHRAERLLQPDIVPVALIGHPDHIQVEPGGAGMFPGLTDRATVFIVTDNRRLAGRQACGLARFGLGQRGQLLRVRLAAEDADACVTYAAVRSAIAVQLFEVMPDVPYFFLLEDGELDFYRLRRDIGFWSLRRG